VIKNTLIRITFLVISIGIFGCNHTAEMSRLSQFNETIHVDYSLIYYIHADSDYLYHDPDGQPVRENSKVLTTALEVAEAAHSGEVFIYHQRPARKLLGLFPRRSSQFYHFKNGELIHRVKYRHQDKKEAFLATEAQLFNEYRSYNPTDNQRNFFLYFGHEIPSENGKGYHQSLPGMDVNTDSFAKGIQNFLQSDEDRFNLVVLSACNNGTPAMAELLMPSAHIMLASPQNLHLSHFDSGSMALLEEEPGISSFQLAHSLAEQTYQRLVANIHTTIALTLYDFEYVQTYINNLTSLSATNKTSDRTVQFQDNVDCADINPFVSETSYREGVVTWYKPARFGRESSGSSHSGWGCKPGM
jgi:hypothetical protein